MGVLPPYNALTASAKIIPATRIYSPKYEAWQDQAWEYYDAIGEFEYGVSWLANTMSRVRLLAAEISSAGDEPIPIENGPAADAISRLAGGIGGQAQLMKKMTVHLSVPGEGWLVGEQNKDDDESWTVKSADELKVGRGAYQVKEDAPTNAWRSIGSDSLVVRFWNPHPRRGWEADSAARHALSALLELDLANKRIIATIVSRLASNGILLYDKGRLSFPASETQPEDGDEVDPFAKILVDVASRGIKDPMSPEAAIPIPIGFDLAEGLQDVNPALLLQHIKIESPLDQKLLDDRDAATRKLATSMDMPAEILLGLGDVNHWSAWQIEESGIKIHVSPAAELICNSLTTGYMVPYLKAANADLRGPNGGKIIVWYDPSEITSRPDKSSNVLQAYDRMEASGETLRREIGIDEDDKPDNAELRIMALKKLVAQGAAATNPAIIDELVGTHLAAVSPVVTGSPAVNEDPGEIDSDRDIPDRPDEPDSGPPSDEQLAASAMITLDRLSDDELLDEFKRRFTAEEPSGGWVPAGTPLETRVTKSRRDTTLVE